MSREIKFRGKLFDNGEWKYGNLIIDDSGNCEIVDYENNYEIRYDVRGETIGQYTGLTDKNGKEIYEGDIIESKRLDGLPLRHIVVYAQNVASFTVQLARAYDYSSINQDWIFKHLKTVVGNIHDNPELLEGGNE